MKVYIAGPMSGYEQHNFPAFFEAEIYLRAYGLGGQTWSPADSIVNPARINEHLGKDQDWHVYLRNDIKQLADCDAIYMLRGWEQSRGAQLEFHIAERLGMKVYFQESQS